MPAIYFNGLACTARDGVLESLGMRNGQNVTEKQLFQVMNANAAAFCADMRLRSVQGLDAPDTSQLESLLGFGGRDADNHS